MSRIDGDLDKPPREHPASPSCCSAAVFVKIAGGPGDCARAQAENKFKCPCHGSQYNNEGKVVRGPAPLVSAVYGLGDGRGSGGSQGWHVAPVVDHVHAILLHALPRSPWPWLTPTSTMLMS